MILVAYAVAYLAAGFIFALVGWKLGQVKADEGDFANHVVLWPIFLAALLLILVLWGPVAAYKKFIKYLQSLDRSK